MPEPKKVFDLFAVAAERLRAVPDAPPMPPDKRRIATSQPRGPRKARESPPESVSLTPLPPQAPRRESLAQSVSQPETVRPTESGVDLWAGVTDWKEGYLSLPNVVLFVIFRHLKPAERCVYLELFALSWGFGQDTCRVNLSTLAKRAGLGTTATHDALSRLQSKGLVVISDRIFGKGKQQGNDYRLPLPVRLTESIRLTRGGRLPESKHIKEKNINTSVKSITPKLSNEERAEIMAKHDELAARGD